MSEEERQVHLAEVIELGEELFAMALASHQGSGSTQNAGDEEVLAQQKKMVGNADELRAAAEKFFRVLRKLALAPHEGN